MNYFCSMEATRGPFTISTDKQKLDIAYIHHFLSVESYWAVNIPLAVVQKAIAGSLCFGLYDGEKQIGFSRMVTDCATFAFLADVFVDPAYRGKGLSKWLMETILAQPEFEGMRRIALATRDAHTLYAQYGFKPLDNPERWMIIHNPNVYKGK